MAWTLVDGDVWQVYHGVRYLYEQHENTPSNPAPQSLYSQISHPLLLRVAVDLRVRSTTPTRREQH